MFAVGCSQSPGSVPSLLPAWDSSSQSPSSLPFSMTLSITAHLCAIPSPSPCQHCSFLLLYSSQLQYSFLCLCIPSVSSPRITASLGMQKCGCSALLGFEQRLPCMDSRCYSHSFIPSLKLISINDIDEEYVTTVRMFW